MEAKAFDVIIIGSGPAGYVAAIRCAQLGMSTACVEKHLDASNKPLYGGTCLNVGCIPSKALLEASHKYHDVQHNYAELGIKTTSVKLDLATMMARKEAIVSKLTGGIAALLKGNGITSISGTGKLVSANQIEVTNDEGTSSSYQASNIILASGSEPVAIPSVPYDGKNIVDSSGALAFDSVPPKLCVIGAGVIGLELGSVWSRLGSEVIVLEAMSEFLPMVDRDLSKQAYKDFCKQGLDIRLGCMVEKADIAGKKKSQVKLTYKDSEGKSRKIEVDKLVVAVGRKPVTENLFAEGIGVEKDERGYIQVDNQCRTGLSNVFAIGDIVRGPMLAHKGSEEGVMVAEILAGRKTQVNYEAIPNVIYTSPEVAWVGKTSQDCDDAKVKTGTFPFAAIGRAMANNDTRGMVKVIADKETDQILGIHIYGQHAGELVSQAVTSLEFMASSEDLSLMTYAHPTLSEAVHEAALAVDGHAIHMVNRKKKRD